jgi:predicted O-methyltransferase YrrM
MAVLVQVPAPGTALMHLPWRDVAPGAGPVISTSVTAGEASMLSALAEGRTVLEIGSAFGYSAVLMALAGAEGVTAVDPHDWIAQSYEIMTANLAAYGVADRVGIVRKQSQDFFPLLASVESRFGMVFIDGDHSAPAATHDMRWAVQLVDPGGVIVVHDVGETCCCPGVGEAARVVFPEGGVMVDTMLVVQQ